MVQFVIMDSPVVSTRKSLVTVITGVAGSGMEVFEMVLQGIFPCKFFKVGLISESFSL